MIHAHIWEPYFVEFNEPLPPEHRYESKGSSTYDMHAFGFTNVTMKCRKCPATRIEQHIGRVSL
jgi:hypothetical protein